MIAMHQHTITMYDRRTAQLHNYRGSLKERI